MNYTCGHCGEKYSTANAAIHCAGHCMNGPGPITMMDEPFPKIEMIKPPSALDHQEGGGHYKDLKIQPIEFIHANGIPFAEGCVIKYVTRWRAKNGLADLKKARHFLDLLIELEERAK